MATNKTVLHVVIYTKVIKHNYTAVSLHFLLHNVENQSNSEQLSLYVVV